MTQPRRGLGRGLDALFGGGFAGSATVPPPAAPPPAETPAEQQDAAPAAEELAAPEATIEPAAPAPTVEDPAVAAPVARPVETAPPAEPAYRAPDPVPPPVAEPVAAPAVAEPPRPEPAPAYRQPEPEPAPRPAYEPPARPSYTAPAPPPAPAPAPAAVAATTHRRGQPEYVDVDLISPNPDQPRTNFEPEKLRELADSIREHGIIQPLVVSRDDSNGYRLIAGERRLQAARLSGLDRVPVIIREAEESELLELALVENIQRADLNPIEEAMAYRRLTDEYGLTQEEAAKRVGKNRVTVANSLRLLQLEPEIRRSLVAGEITEGHARALLGLPDARARMNAWREVVKRRMSVRDTEAHVRKSLAESPATANTPGAQTARRDATIADIESRLQRALSTRVSVLPQKKGARILIECYSAEEFEGVVAAILREDDDYDR
ncbi:MAG: ParB/RepB/Spo0J family partition protein [Dehalococcoidia bacterium]|nr:ParB/RepB/Spo0J family partition protein [Dehalococcoidia bacterium]